ncbi:MAG: putative triple gene block protein 1 [Xinjiang alphaflexivirus 2]|nr:MAG: putative triple gene block protein 1 [Xinjiang alphaflexivirus 2]
MDHILALLDTQFTRTRLPISKPIVVHAIAGSGKSTLIRQILTDLPNAKAYTLGKPDPYTLQGNFIQHFARYKRGPLDILDEYAVLPLAELENCFEFVFTDPYQSPSEDLLEPHFICEKTHRFSQSTCTLLNHTFSTNITTTRTEPDNITFGDPFIVDPIGQIIAFQEDIYLLLCLHQAPYFKVKHIIGEQYPVVTLYLSTKISEIPEDQRYLLFIALTRHTEKLLILGPDAFDTSA